VGYFDEEDNVNLNVNPWPGNHAYLNGFRNQMTHRISTNISLTNISSIYAIGITLRPPVMYVLHRATEDYYTVSSFLCGLINTSLGESRELIPAGLESDK